MVMLVAAASICRSTCRYELAIGAGSDSFAVLTISIDHAPLAQAATTGIDGYEVA